MTTIRDAQDQLADLHPLLRSAVEEFESDYGTDIPIVGFGTLGSTMMGKRHELDDDVKQRFFAKAEELLANGDDETQTAVATGLLEAVANAAERAGIPRSRLYEWLGPESQAFVTAWDEFDETTIGTSPGDQERSP